MCGVFGADKCRASEVRFTPESGHSDAQERFRLKKQTPNVRPQNSPTMLPHQRRPPT